MRHVVMLLAVSSLTVGAAGAQPASSAPGPRACAVLTRDLVAPLTENKSILDLIPPEEEVLATGGTACEHGAVRLQLSPGRGGKRTLTAPGLQPVQGAGDGGFFRSNQNRYAELAVWTSRHSLDLQVSVPSGRTAEDIKPQVIALANAILAKLP